MIDAGTADAIVARYRLRRVSRTEYAGMCPNHGGSSAPFKLKVAGGIPLFHCHGGCSQDDVIDALSRDGVLPEPENVYHPALRRHSFAVPQTSRRREAEISTPAEPASRDLSPEASELWDAAKPRHPLLRAYLDARGIWIEPPACLRLLLPGIGSYGTMPQAPRMVAMVTDAVTALPSTLHFTALKSDGSGKSDVIDKPKRLLAGHRKAGGVIRLSPDDSVTLGLGIAEGTETGLSVMAAGWSPVWVTVDAGNMAAFPVLDGIQSLAIWADKDKSEAGQKAAAECADRWRAAGREVAILMPPEVGRDWNDLARAS